MYWGMFYSAGYQSGYNERKAKIEAKHYASGTANQIERECSAKTGEAARKCITEIVDSERESERGESDLAAQWKAADWVMWAGVIAATQLIATIAGLYYIKGTLDETRKAVEDTGKATLAMQRQNDLVEAAQRAWVAIDFEIEGFLVRRGRLTITYVVRFKNIGSTLAENFSHFARITPEGATFTDSIKRNRDEWSRPKGPAESALMPGEEKVFTGIADFRISELPWTAREIDPFCNIIIHAAAFYNLTGAPGFGNRKVTMRAARIGIECEDRLRRLVMFKKDMATEHEPRAYISLTGKHVTT